MTDFVTRRLDVSSREFAAADGLSGRLRSVARWIASRDIYDLAYDKGLKGCTTFRPNPITGMVLSEEQDGTEAPHCCVIEREPD